jgi:hypothetical protein
MNEDMMRQQSVTRAEAYFSIRRTSRYGHIYNCYPELLQKYLMISVGECRNPAYKVSGISIAEKFAA